MVAAIIVLYHPDLPLLDRLLRSLLGQVEMIFAVDNTPGSSDKFAAFFQAYDARITYKPLGDNMGIAFAQNAGIREAIQQGFTHVLLLDQDSAISPNMVQRLLAAESELLQTRNNVAAVGPVFIDEKTGKRSFAIRRGFLRVNRIKIDVGRDLPIQSDHLIASGALIRAMVFRSVGLMREDLFIDWVDIEWCLRAQEAGMQSYIAPDAIMRHCIGDDNVRILGRDINLHSDLRNYYMIRNATYLLRLKTMRRWRTVTVLKVIKYVIFYSIYSDHKRESAKLLGMAVWDGIRGRLGKFQGAHTRPES